MNCVCGHPEKDHAPGGQGRVPDYPRDLFRPGDALRPGRLGNRRPLRLRLLIPLLGLLVGAPGLVAAADPPPASFARTAAVARAASIVIRMPDVDTVIGSVLAKEEAGDVASLTEPPDLLDGLGGRQQRTFAGVIVDPRGLALTSARAVLRSPEFDVSLLDGTPLKTTLLAVDRRSDIAVLKLDSDGGPLPYLSLADSDRVKVGEWVIAVGAPMGLEGTVTAGVITATPRPADLDPLAGLLQTDAVMDRGNAGGPIVAPGGEIVGLSTGISADGIGYARPSPAVRKIYLELVEQGRVSRPWLGVTTQTLSARLARALGARGTVGILIADVHRAGPGAAAGLRSGDIVVAMNATPLSSRAQLEHAVGALAPGRVVRLSVRRAAATLTVRVKLGEEPDESQLTPLVARARRLLGLEAAPLAPGLGVVAADIERGSPAARVGLEAGDIVREVNRRAIRTIADFEAAVLSFAPRVPVLMLVQRGELALYVTLDPRR
jgi:serine protease Do